MSASRPAKRPENRGVRDLTRHAHRRRAAIVSAIAALGLTVPAFAQDEVSEPEPRRTRVTLGAQLYPSFPGSDEVDPGPLINVDRARGDTPFEFEGPDDSFDFALVHSQGFSFGPVLNFEGSRTADDVGAALPKVGFTLELGGFVEYDLGEHFRLRSELRKGLGGHDGWIGTAGADAIFRDGDQWLFSIGPRVTWSDGTYQDSWFGVTPEAAMTSGLPAYDPDGGIQAYGATASFLVQLSERWGISAYAKYDRLTGDAADSPIVRQLGSRDQISGGLGLTYTFGDWVR